MDALSPVCRSLNTFKPLLINDNYCPKLLKILKTLHIYTLSYRYFLQFAGNTAIQFHMKLVMCDKSSSKRYLLPKLRPHHTSILIQKPRLHVFQNPLIPQGSRKRPRLPPKVATIFLREDMRPTARSDCANSLPGKCVAICWTWLPLTCGVF